MVENDELIGSKPMRRLVGDCSLMQIHRLCNSPKYAHLEFPKPVKLDDRPNARNYWWRSEVVAWVKRRLQATAGSVQPPTVVTAKPAQTDTSEQEEAATL
jgi:predicted DNA-binding transcriptional regulator AlpA